MPKVFMRQYLDDSGRTIREIVDGQQRIRTILAYLAGGFPIMHVHGKDDFGDKYYEDLPPVSQDNFLNYCISVDLLVGATDIDVLDIFARLNTYGVRLNKQELINASYFGHFKQTVYSLGYEFYKFWIDNRILSDQDIARMLEAELASELVIAMLVGIQSRKVLENYYKKYDNEFPEKATVTEKFKHTMDLIGEITENRLGTSSFSSKHLFYSLYCSIYDLCYGLPGTQTERIQFDSRVKPRVANTLWDIDTLLEMDISEIQDPQQLRFVSASTRRTTDMSARKTRHEYITGRVLGDLQPRRA
jgi:hypothetical protein